MAKNSPSAGSTASTAQTNAPTSPEGQSSPREGAATGPTIGELEERNDSLEQENLALKARLDALEARFAQGFTPAAKPRAPSVANSLEKPGMVVLDPPPEFDMDAPHGLVVGHHDTAYVQDGHHFARDRSYIATEPHRGSPRAFNPKLIGVVRPRVVQSA